MQCMASFFSSQGEAQKSERNKSTLHPLMKAKELLEVQGSNAGCYLLISPFHEIKEMIKKHQNHRIRICKERAAEISFSPDRFRDRAAQPLSLSWSFATCSLSVSLISLAID